MSVFLKLEHQPGVQIPALLFELIYGDYEDECAYPIPRDGNTFYENAMRLVDQWGLDPVTHSFMREQVADMARQIRATHGYWTH